MINDHYIKQDLSLFTSGSRFNLANLFIKEKMDKDLTTFDLFVRELPKNRNYLVFCGLEHVVDYLLNLSFNNKQLVWIKKNFGFRPEIMEYFKNFRFTGNMFAMCEGSIFFANEPIIRITAPIIEAQIIEMFLINAVYYQTILASKISRFMNTVAGKQVVFGYNRSYGIDPALKAIRVQKVMGVTCGLPMYQYKYSGSPFSHGTFHYLMMMFDKEIDAFKSYMDNMGGSGYVLVDTYHTVKGIDNFIKATKSLEKKGMRAVGIQLDSGDLYELSVKARKMLDRAGLNYVKIFAMSNLNEYRAKKLIDKNAPIDIYAGATEILTPTDAPILELVYKLSQVEKNKKIIPKMKLSSKKISLPGKKQVFRVSKNGKYDNDIIGLENEKIDGTKMLVSIIQNGKLVYNLPPLEKISKYYLKEMQKFDDKLFYINRRIKYPVVISEKLKQLTKKTKQEIISKHY